VSLDINTDSNTRQRDLCHTDAYITGIGQLSLSSEYGVSQMTAEDGFQQDSNIWQGMVDFRSALISLAYEQALYSGDLSLVSQRYVDMQMHSLAGSGTTAVQGFFDPSLGLVNKSGGMMGTAGGKCPASWSPAGMPDGVYEALKCTASDLIDWPSGTRDGYKESAISAVPNAYVALAAGKLSKVAGWLERTADAQYYGNVSATILTNLRTKLYNRSSGAFVDGLAAPASQHSSMHATLFSAMAGAVDEAAVPGMGLAVVATLKAKGMRCSCMAAHWLLEGLYKIGWHTSEAADHALDVLTSNSSKSWLGMIAQGATATMEAWTRDEKPNLSWSHPWCAGANSVIVRLLLGVQPLSPGWTRWQFAPQPSSLPAIQATVPSLRGTINVTISNGGGGGGFSATLTVPEGTLARVCLPPAHGTSAKLAAALKLDGTEAKSEVQGRMLCFADDVKPGAHTVSRKALKL
jgi:alpha-L-rhamnosidase